MSTTGQSQVPPAGATGSFGGLRMTPGRWVALAVGVPAALALIGWTGFSLVAATARGSYPFSLPVPVYHGQVAVNVTAVNVTLRPGSSGAARLTGIVQYGLIRPSISDDSIGIGDNIGVNCDGIIGSNCDVNATLDVPARTAVALWSNGGDVQASGFSGGMTLWAEGGNVTASNLAGDLRLDTGGGDLTADGLTGDLQLSAEGGDVDATGVASEVAGVDSGGGNVTLTFTKVPQTLEIASEGGDVTVILPPGRTRYDIATPDNQGANVSYPLSLSSSESHDKITIDSGGGDITVSQG